ncbi:probable S-adenosylmethionine-dependent methyltransferase At5g38100 [Lingula anatina]|uniref:Probable S-adenosylmethionine-dependent methyltransferase At5g38100 n=1 Tax=Lingula anatina TaxID=7574 RepID=A0A1S3H436_LINAN|nr:probable S-adenosylmethionine-dependent methyltransferase At5g38100 [Lingula anatina]XP_013380232.1 probable S-adenosylmethionine-dependent methyltransferase At5g38100 [Lingula anatina]XP_013380233.1 probable S-adenosylmethionine-dependent methyltransferase At5g38100 [Lingula anatina]XP_013380235.1 probable S-adenosylmethionine-dependent methyltransferase At5g38100 [Lingula anatina]XP_013380236.1 probable S-adenosylmethionine-dependent methyltransferase At5g38100 [Lingula anatina]XP_0133802|eukprot:XP_013380231.1 probable S-adenosylmethionine-dependent methyltransferase At5g38100 [Lingula anatina]
MQVPHSHIPYGKEGSGFYTDNTIGCFNVIDAATPMVLNALGNVPVKDLESPFIIADFGTADGGTSMFLLKKMIELLRKKHGKDLPVQVVYEDQPVNDFKSLFFRVHGLLSYGPPSYVQEFDNVYVLASGTSFYSQCLPPGSLHFGMSFTAMHWLTTRPGKVTGALHHTDITDLTEKALFQAQAAKDWETILLARAKELKSGGRMVVVCFCVDKEGQYLGNTKYIKEHMFHNFNKYWKEMVTEGEITQEEFDNTNFNNYYRTIEEYSAPFNDHDSAVSKAGMKLVTIETKVVRCPYNERWVREGKKDDPEAAAKHAKWYIPTLRTWSNSTFLSGLDSSRSEEEKAAIVDKFFMKYERAVASAPEDHGMDYVHAYIDIERN